MIEPSTLSLAVSMEESVSLICKFGSARMAALELAFDRQLLAAKRLPINTLDEARPALTKGCSRKQIS
jgi:hypothetical protein